MTRRTRNYNKAKQTKRDLRGAGLATRWEVALAEAKRVHGDKYDYSQVLYKNANDKVTIVCRKHGPFQQTFGNHLRAGNGCRQCANEAKSANNYNKVSTADLEQRFKEEAAAIHGKRYDYSAVSYVGKNSQDKVTIVCRLHGEFSQTYGKHVGRKDGCPKCSKGRFGETDRRLRRLLEAAQEVHGSKYDYSLAVNDFETVQSLCRIVCPEHGVFEQSISNHVYQSCGCPYCSTEAATVERFGTVAERLQRFKQDAFRHHGREYTYPHLKEEFQSGKSKITVVCPKCGPWKQYASGHTSGRGCPNCRRSAAEKYIERWLRKLLPGESVQASNRTLIKPYELDIYVPSKKLAIEYCGVYWHSAKDKTYHASKQKACEEHGVRLITIFDTEWNDPVKRKIIKARLRSAVGLSIRRVFARKCNLVELSASRARTFFDNNHLAGHASGSIYLGLKDNTGLVAAISLGKPRFSANAEWELLRACSKRGVLVVGGVSKLIKAFTRAYQPTSLLSYADLRFGTGRSYAAAGLTLVRVSAPSPWWAHRGAHQGVKLYHGSRVQKHKLAKLLPHFDPGLTANENLKLNSWVCVYDCGHNVWEWKRPQGQVMLG